MSFSESLDDIVAEDRNHLLGQHVSWKRVRLRDVADILNGFPFGSELFSSSGSGTPLIRIRDILRNATETFFSGDYPDEFMVTAGALLVGMDGDFNSSVWRGEPGLLNQRCCKLSVTTSDYDPRFLAYCLPGYLAAINAHTSAITVKHLSSRTIADIPLPLPPLAEQRRIADALDELLSDVDAGGAALERVKAKLKHYRGAVLKAAVEGALTEEWRAQHPATESATNLLARILAERRRRWEEAQLKKFKESGKEPPKNWKAKYQEPVAPDLSSLPPLPGEWCWASVEQLSAPEPNSITDGPFGSNLMTAHYTAAGPRVIRLQNIKDGSFADERAHISEERFAHLKKHAVQAGDIVIAGLSENPPRACIIPASLGPAIVKADCIRFKPHKELFSECICFFLNSIPTRTRMKQIVHGVGRPRLNLGEIRAIALPLAPITEQEVIFTEVEDQLSVIEHLEADLEARLKSAHALRQSILRHAFTGQLVPQDPEDEPAAELLKRIAAQREELARQEQATKTTKPKALPKRAAKKDQGKH